MLQIPVYPAMQMVYETVVHSLSDVFECGATPEDMRDAYLNFRSVVSSHTLNCPLDDIDEYAFCAPVTDKPLNAVFLDDGNGKWSVVIRNYK